MAVKVACFILCFCVAGNAAGQLNSRLEKAYQALSVYDYFKAKELFYKDHSKRKTHYSAYGLATIFSRKDNPFHQLDSAAKYAQEGLLLFSANSVSATSNGFVMDGDRFVQLKQTCTDACYREAFLLQSVSGWDHFLGTNFMADMGLREEVLLRRDELELKFVKEAGSSRLTNNFLIEHPQSVFYREAALFMERQVYEEETAGKTETELNRFLKKHPKNHMRNTALEQLYTIYRKKGDVEGLKHFVKDYPESTMLHEAWKTLFSLSVKSYTDEELIKFLAMYPDFPLKNSILQELHLSSRVYWPFADGDLYGYLDTNGTIVVPPQYEGATGFSEELAVVTRNDSVWYINKLNQMVFGQVFEDGFVFNSGAAPVKSKGLWKFINRQGQVISPDFEEINEMSDDLYVVKSGGLYGAIDRNGQERLQARYQYLGNFHDGIAIYREGDRCGYLSSGGFEYRAEFDWMSTFDQNQLAVIRKGNRFGLLRLKGGIVLPAQYEQVLHLEGENYLVVKEDKYGFFSAEGCFLSEVIYDFQKELPLEFYSRDNWFRLLKKKKTGLIDQNGATRLNFGVFEDCSFFSEDILAVKRRGKYGYTDRKLQPIIPCMYDEAGDFVGGVALVKKGQEYLVIESTGKVRFAVNTELVRLNSTKFLQREAGEARLLDTQGAVLLDHIVREQAIAKGYTLFWLKSGEIKLLKL